VAQLTGSGEPSGSVSGMSWQYHSTALDSSSGFCAGAAQSVSRFSLTMRSSGRQAVLAPPPTPKVSAAAAPSASAASGERLPWT